jgi:hypothetical protein
VRHCYDCGKDITEDAWMENEFDYEGSKHKSVCTPDQKPSQRDKTVEPVVAKKRITGIW